MIKKLKEFTKTLNSQKGKKVTIRVEDLEAFCSLPKPSRKLFIEMIYLTGYGYDPKDLILKFNIEQVGFKDWSNFYKARKPLIDKNWIHVNDNQYIINPSKVNYYTSRQYPYFKRLFGIVKDCSPFGKNTAPPPPIDK